MQDFNALPLFMSSAPHNGTDTSRDAAANIREHLGRLEFVVFAAVACARDAGVTNDEIEVITGLAGNTVRPRIVRLREMGLVRDSQRRRPTRSGRAAVVWQMVQQEG